MPRHITTTISDGIAHVRLARPDKLNALTLEMLDDLAAVAHGLRSDRRLRAVVISGEGDSFCAGLDFGSAMKKPSGIVSRFVPRQWRGTNTFQEAPWAFRRLPVPVIAAGLRVAAVSNVSIVSVASLVGISQLGDLLVDGFNRAIPGELVAGIAGCIVLALLFDVLIRLLERLLTPWRRAGASA